MLRFDSPTPSVVPGEDGSVELVWHKAGWDVEVEVAPAEIFVWARHRENGDTWHGELYEVKDLLRDVLDSMKE